MHVLARITVLLLAGEQGGGRWARPSDVDGGGEHALRFTERVRVSLSCVAIAVCVVEVGAVVLCVVVCSFGGVVALGCGGWWVCEGACGVGVELSSQWAGLLHRLCGDSALSSTLRRSESSAVGVTVR